MKSSFTADYAGYLILRVLGPLIRRLPVKTVFLIGKLIGETFYFFDRKHVRLAESNIRAAFGERHAAGSSFCIARKFFRTFGQNLVEIFMIPVVDRKYIEKYIQIRGYENIKNALAKKKGVIFLGVHAGGWELSNIVSANLGIPYSMFVRQMRYPRMSRLLNSYRTEKGCKLIERENELRTLIQTLKNNEAVGMSIDQGGLKGVRVKFFGLSASMSQGAIRIGLSLGASLVPVFINRINGPYTRIEVGKPLELKKTGDLNEDVRSNLQEAVNLYQEFISKYPWEYLWTYKIWKYGLDKNILILSDLKTGHIRQSETLAKITADCLKEKGFHVGVSILEGKKRGSIGVKPDIVISCGSSLARLNLDLAYAYYAKSFVIMRPPVYCANKFDLEVVPRHDNAGMTKKRIITEGALNLVGPIYLKESSLNCPLKVDLDKEPVIGLLLGGDTKGFNLDVKLAREIFSELKSVLEKVDGLILVTTSRRTSKDVEQLLKKEFLGHPRCRILVVPNEKDVPFALGKILADSSIIVVSPESISMVSEAANSRKPVVVFKAGNLSKKHQRFLEYFEKKKYIYTAKPRQLCAIIQQIWENKPQPVYPQDYRSVKEAVAKVLGLDKG
jgi:lauroyl/myristoyl acyltransferase